MSAINKIKIINKLKGSFDLLIVGANSNTKNLSFPSGLSNDIQNDLKMSFSIEQEVSQKSKKILSYSNGEIKRTCLYGYSSNEDSDALRSLGANIIKYSKNYKNIAIDLASFSLKNDDQEQAFIEGLVLGTYEFLDYKKKDTPNKLSNITLIGDTDKKIVDKATVIANGVCYARDLSNHPPNILTPTYIANDAVKIAKSNKNMKSKIIDVSKFQSLGLGSFYGVAMGAHEPAKLILVEYNGGKKGDKPIALVGKGLTFDSGGISIKPSAKMDEMKFDMCGSSTVMGVMKAVAELNPKLNIIFAIGSTENMPGGKAQRPGDIVTAYNGKTIEVLNTDAEGRLVLADVLAYVVKNYSPSEILDFATLTGAVLVALGDRASGLMGNNPNLIEKIKKASDKSGERVWELPMWKEYTKDIKSKVADIRNLGRPPLAGTIAGGVFLQEFVDDIPWCHIDIAGTAWGPKEPSYQPATGATGVGVRLVYQFLENSLN
tara:strand:+ start:3639 stop:5105 length:1467 start_codon:yes stop_codon:yes gene_type:complete